MVDNSLWLCNVCYRKIGSAQECYTDYNWTNMLCEACLQVVAVHHVVNRSGSISIRPQIEWRDANGERINEAGSVQVGNTDGVHIVIDSRGIHAYGGERLIW